MASRNIVQSDAEQSRIFDELINRMVEQGQIITTPQVPGQVDTNGTTPPPQPKGPPNNDGSIGETGDSVKKDTPAVPNQVAIQPQKGSSVTSRVANAGQLIPIAPPAAPSSGGSDIAEVKKLIAQVMGTQDNSTPAPSSGGGGGGGILGDIASVATAFLAWIICTELMRQGKMPRKWWIKGAPVFAAYPQFVKDGYFLWAIPCVQHLRNSPNSWFSRFLCVTFNARAQSIAEKRTIRGTLVTIILWPICWMLGAALWLLNRRPDWTSVYRTEI